MRRSPFLMVLFALGALGLSGCDEVRKALGQTKDPPDEFAVFTRAPLSLPPDYGLRPPTPGAERPQAVNPRDRARQALVASGGRAGQPAKPKSAPLGKVSAGEDAILRRTGAVNSDPAIRQLVNQETSFLAEEDKTLTDRIVFWGVKTEYGTVLDPAKEAKRIRERQAFGESMVGKVPTIKRKHRGMLEGVFD